MGKPRSIVFGILLASFVGPGVATADVVIGHVMTRDWKVTVSSSADGVRYTVRGRDGEAVATRLTQRELAARFPDAGAAVSGVAEARDPRIIVWAGR